MSILKSLFGPKGKKNAQNSIKKDPLEDLMKKSISIEKVMEKVEEMKKIVIIEDEKSIAFSLMDYLESKFPDKEILVASTIDEAEELREKVIDSETWVYLDNMIEGKRGNVEYGNRVYNLINEKAGYVFICSHDLPNNFIGKEYMHKQKMMKEIAKPIIKFPEDLINALKENENLLIIDDETADSYKKSIALRWKKPIETATNWEEVENLIREGKIGEKTVILLDNKFPEKAEGEKVEDCGKKHYFELRELSKHIFIISSDEAENFRGRRYLGRDAMFDFFDRVEGMKGV